MGSQVSICAATQREAAHMADIASAAAISVVLVHAGFVDGSGWEGVSKILKKDG
jgi:hypothetical protein